MANPGVEGVDTPSISPLPPEEMEQMIAITSLSLQVMEMNKEANEISARLDALDRQITQAGQQIEGHTVALRDLRKKRTAETQPT